MATATLMKKGKPKSQDFVRRGNQHKAMADTRLTAHRIIAT
ncbi:MAG TPA: hypothetical protein VHK86_01730 [Nitrososphaera sp.]|nr:hypothetical protein [Nitrososphaera sp.]